MTLWHKDCLRRFIVGHHIPDRDQKDYVPGIFTRLDPEKFVRRLKRAGVEVFQIYAKCHYGNAYYNTKIGHKHSAIGDRDLFQEYITACRKEGIVPVCIYEWADYRIQQEHPDWDRLFSPYREFSRKQIEEIVAQYDIEGLYVDMVDFSLNPNSRFQQEAYQKDFGTDLPAKDWNSAAWKECIRWIYRKQARFMEEVREIVARSKPGLPVTHNLHIFPNFAYTWGNGLEETAAVDDFAWNDTFGSRDGYLTVSVQAKLFRAISRLTPEILIDTMADVLGRTGDLYTSHTRACYLAQAMTLIANGVALQSACMLHHDGTWNETIMDTIAYVNREISKVQPTVCESAPLPYAAIVFSERTRDYYGRDDVNAWALSFYGMFSLLLEYHIPFDILPDTRITAESLDRYQVLVLPSIVCMAKETAGLIRDFVNRGGTLIATDLTSAWDANGTEYPAPLLADLFGVSFGEYITGRHFFIEPVRQFDCREKLLFFPEDMVKVQPAEGTEILAHTRERLQPKSLCVAIGDRANHPFAVVRRTGKGACFYFAGHFGRGYAKTAHHQYREFFHQVLDMHLTPPIRVHAPSCIEAIFSRNTGDGSLNVFLINLQADMKRVFFQPSDPVTAFAPLGDQILPVRNILVECARSGIRSVTDIASGKSLPFTAKSGRTVIKVPQIKTYRALRIVCEMSSEDIRK